MENPKEYIKKVGNMSPVGKIIQGVSIIIIFIGGSGMFSGPSKTSRIPIPTITSGNLFEDTPEAVQTLGTLALGTATHIQGRGMRLEIPIMEVCKNRAFCIAYILASERLSHR